MVEEKEKRYIVSVGKYKDEKAALTRQSVARQNGLSCEIIDTENDSLANINAALMLIAEQLNKLIEMKPEIVPEKTVRKGYSPSVSALIESKRKALGYTQVELGAIMGVSGNCISNWVTRGNIPESNVKRLQLVLRITEDEWNEAVRNS